MNHRPLFQQLLLLLCLPLLLLLLLSGVLAGQWWQEWDKTQQSISEAQEIARITELQHHLQRERGLSLGFTAAQRQRFVEELAEQREHTGVLWQAAPFRPEPLSQLQQLRELIDKGALPPERIVQRYRGWIDQLQRRSEQLSDSFSLTTYHKWTALTQLQQAKEQAGLERALLTAAFSRNYWPADAEAFWQETRWEQRLLLKQFTLSLPDWEARLSQSLRGAAGAEQLAAMRRIAQERWGAFDQDPERWWEFATARIDVMYEVERALLAEMTREAQEQGAQVQQELGLGVLLLLLSLPTVWGVMLGLGKKLAHPLVKIRKRLEDMVTNEQYHPELMQQQLYQLDLNHLPAGCAEVQTMLSALGRFQQHLLEINGKMVASEEELRVTNEHLLATQQDLLIATRRESMNEMLSMLAHQWRQPLSQINSMAANIQLQSQFLDGPTQKIQLKAEQIQQATQQLSHTIKEFRKLFEENPRPTSVSLPKLLQQLLQQEQPLMSEAKIQLITEISEDLPPLVTIASEIETVVRELQQNAMEALENKPANASRQLTVRLYAQEDGAQIVEVEDNAGGVPEEVLPKIFEPYFSTKKQRHGVGLGLYTCRMLAEQHLCGRLECHNHKHGACFRFTVASLL
jgi:signal transduction histidine kinase